MRNPGRIRRREFLHTGLAGTAALLGAPWVGGACRGTRRVRGVCTHDCPDSCAWTITTDGDRAVALEGDPHHPLTQGSLCEKMDGFLTDVVYNPDRILHPLRRVGAKGEGRFERTSWDEALDDVAARLEAVIEEHGPTAVLPYSFYGTEGMVQASSLDRRFFARLAPWGSRYLSLNLPAIEPRGEALPNTEFFRRLARRLGLEGPYLYVSDEEIVRAALESDHPYLSGITFERLRREGWVPMNIPEPWIPFAAGGFPTPSGKCELYVESLIEEGLDPLPRHDPPKGEPTPAASLYPLTFMSSKSQRYFLNSSHANQPRHRRAAGEPRLQIHPDDAARQGIANGDTLRAYNARGSVELAAEVSDGTRPGLVAMAHGWWPSLVPGGSTANALTSDGLSDLGGGAALYDARVEVEKIA